VPIAAGQHGVKSLTVNGVVHPAVVASFEFKAAQGVEPSFGYQKQFCVIPMGLEA
jgi:hypothetical protein